ncbi:MAG: hypothetical protein V4792_09420 [Pseudomonadota bacterium]
MSLPKGSAPPQTRRMWIADFAAIFAAAPKGGQVPPVLPDQDFVDTQPAVAWTDTWGDAHDEQQAVVRC